MTRLRVKHCSKHEVRYVWARSLAWMGKQARPAVLALSAALQDSDHEARRCATNILLKIAPEVLGGAR